jgi:3,4-dihydroxy 2-butanone 4-phosphate synthase / GTP cyclohydrolase II
MTGALQNPRTVAFRELVSTPDDIVEDARNGRMFILVDDENREDEGDLVIPAQMATPMRSISWPSTAAA